MNNEKLYEVLGDINEKYVKEARLEKRDKKNFWLKWGALAACFAIILMAGIVVMPMLFDNENIIPPVDNEYKYEKGYFYYVDDDIFSTYIEGKVISDDRIGDKLSDVSVTTGWKNDVGECTFSEKLRGEIYSITGISNDVAVALKFLDKGESVTTTHYYVIMNPSADLTPVAEYIIAISTSNNSSDEMAGIIPE